jgi:hypothetical protein
VSGFRPLSLLLLSATAACSGGQRERRPMPPPRPDLVAPAARLELAHLERAIRLYAEDRAGRLPSRLDDLAVEADRHSGRTYVAKVPRDPWGQPYSYAVTSTQHGTFDLRSYGADTLPGTDDDVVVRGAPLRGQ